MRRIEIKPRQAETKTDAPDAAEVLLHFSCPSCLHMLSAARSQAHAPVQCAQCHAEIMPPQIVLAADARSLKSHLPPPKKTGAHSLRK
jgi:hypothetical protein